MSLPDNPIQKMPKQLFESRKMRSPEEMAAFEEVRLALYSLNDPNVLSGLFAAFDDRAEQHEVM